MEAILNTTILWIIHIIIWELFLRDLCWNSKEVIEYAENITDENN